MNAVLSALSQHGYPVVFVGVFLEAIGFPVPAALVLLIAGAASAQGVLYPAYAFACGLSAMVIADTLMFLLGRYTGWWLLGMLCRLSLNPESCILRSADSFYRRGRTLLLFAKFLPGLNTMAPPLAGSLNMRYFSFFPLDFAGASLYAGTYFGVGFLFSGALGAITRGYETFTQTLELVVAAAVAGYLAFLAWNWRKARRGSSIPLVQPSYVAHAVTSDAALIYDVRSHGYYEPKATRIQGSIRMEPNAIHHVETSLLLEKKVFLYCTCVRQATSARVAQALLEKGVRCSVIEGGLRAWKKAGFPIEEVPAEEMLAMPAFERRAARA